MMSPRESLKVLALNLVVASSLVPSAFANANAANCAAAFAEPLAKQVWTEAEAGKSKISADVDARIKNAKLLAIPMAGEAGRVMYVEAVAPAQPDRPLFLMLPGMNRSGRISDASSVELIREGFGVAELNFSVHPFSVTALGKGVSPSFRRKSPTLQDFAKEVETAMEVLAAQTGAKRIIPVSLSFSGVVTPLIKAQPLIIEVVPMTSERAVNPDGAAYRDQLRAGEIFNPIFGPGITRNLMDQAYRAKWAGQADSIIQTFGLPAERRSDFIEGYTALSRSSEDATWKGKNVSNADRRVFIVAEGDGRKLLKDQLQTYQQFIRDGKNGVLFVVEASGHVVPSDQPLIFAKILETVTIPGGENVSGVVRIRKDGTIDQFAAGKEADTWLATVISAL